MVALPELVERQYRACRPGYEYRNGYCYRRSNFHHWGRWVLAAIIIAGVVVILFLFSCIARRRRRRGVKPMYGTGWMAGGGKWPPNNQSNQMHAYNPNYNQNGHGGGYNNPPPPAYGQQPQQPMYTGTTFNPNDGYYGQQQQGVQPPQGTYQRDDPYGPPPGPPPGK